MINGSFYDQVLFVHIPKTAGTSIFAFLEKNELDNWKRGYKEYPRKHEPYFILKQNNLITDAVFSFAVVRNPYTRTYSCFNQFNKDHKTNITLEEYLTNIFNKKISKLTPLLHLPQSFYILNDNKEVLINKVYRFENIKELEY